MALKARRRVRGTWLMLGLALALTLACPLTAHAADSGTESAVKAAYLVKFPAFVDWPATAFDSPSAALVIGVLGADHVLAELELLAGGRRVNGRLLVVRRVLASGPHDGLHLLHVGQGTAAPPLPGRPVLVVTDTPTGLPEHAVLNFVTVDRRVRFEASLAAAERAGLKLSARLLAVAERVRMP